MPEIANNLMEFERGIETLFDNFEHKAESLDDNDKELAQEYLRPIIDAFSEFKSKLSTRLQAAVEKKGLAGLPEAIEQMNMMFDKLSDLLETGLRGFSATNIANDAGELETSVLKKVIKDNEGLVMQTTEATFNFVPTAHSEARFKLNYSDQDSGDMSLRVDLDKRLGKIVIDLQTTSLEKLLKDIDGDKPGEYGHHFISESLTALVEGSESEDIGKGGKFKEVVVAFRQLLKESEGLAKSSTVKNVETGELTENVLEQLKARFNNQE